jgi:aminopeptidase N
MEYPMICWNFGRPDENGKYTDQTKYGMLGVICHEIGHNYFPMIVNSDERQWTWMDEGLNSFLEYLAEISFDPNFPTRKGPAKNIVPYMSGDQKGLEPIMTNSESIRQFGNNAYGKPATALNILRETIMGHELFDYAFKTYANRWKFKHPTPEDFFRTMEDASAVDLDWFWRGWFYGTDNVDISIDEVKWFQLNTQNPEVEKTFKKEIDAQKDTFIGDERNKTSINETVNEKDKNIDDFYSTARKNKFVVEHDMCQNILRKKQDDSRACLCVQKNYFFLSVLIVCLYTEAPRHKNYNN